MTGLNVTFYVRSLPFHQIGGMENICWDLATGLAARGHQVRIVTTTLPDNVPAFTNIELVAVPGTIPGRYSRRWWQGSAEDYRTMAPALSTDVAVSIGRGGFRAVRYRLEVGIPFLYQAHGTSLGEGISKFRERDLVKAMAALRDFGRVFQELSLHPQFDLVIAAGYAVERYLHRFPYTTKPPDFLVTIPNGIAFPKPLDTRAMLPNGLADSGRKVLVTCSRLHRQKGIQLVIAALRHLPNVHLLVIGDGPQLPELQRLTHAYECDGRVHFVGAVPRQRALEYVGAADAFAFPTLREETGVPLNVMEALSFGIPTVLSASLRDLVRLDDPSIFYVAPSDDRQMIDAIRAATSLPKSPALASTATAQFSLDNMIACYEDLLRKIAGQGRS